MRFVSKAFSPPSLCLLLFLVANLANMGLGKPVRLSVEKRLSQLPLNLAGYRGTDERFEDSIYKVIGTDDNLLRLYTKDKTDFNWLYVGYYGTNKGGRTGHLPHHCFPSSGYRIKSSSKEQILLASGLTVTANLLLVEKKGRLTSCLYWYQSKNEVQDSGWKLNWKRFRDRIKQGQDDGAFVRILAPVGSSYGQTISRQKEFAAAVINSLPTAWPREIPSMTSLSNERS